MITFNYKECPRCNTTLTSSDFNKLCLNCNLQYNSAFNYVFLEGIIDVDHSLSWELDREHCLYYVSTDFFKRLILPYSSAMTYSRVILPFLPFNISKEKLQLYLLLS